MGSKKRTIRIPGVNIQYPWSRLIITGRKTVETRHYKLPSKYINKEIALIETPGAEGKKKGIKSKVIGIIVISECIKYESKKDWLNDKKYHLVENNDPLYAFSNKKEKWGWVIKEVRKISPQPPPIIRGIKYAKECILII